MTPDLRALYDEVILDHCRNPRNFGVLEGADRVGEGFNPVCGDRVTVYLQVTDGVIREIGFQGACCAIATASASLMTCALRGRTLARAKDLIRTFHGVLAGELKADAGGPALGELAVFAGVSQFPARVQCAGLPWHTLEAALAPQPGP
jgi:nitrogen fixation NifU-like protein